MNTTEPRTRARPSQQAYRDRVSERQARLRRRFNEAMDTLQISRAVFGPSKSFQPAKRRVFLRMAETLGDDPGLTVHEIAEVCGYAVEPPTQSLCW